MRGAAAASCERCADCDGANSVEAASGDNAWVAGAATNQTYLVLDGATAAGDAIDQLLCQAPTSRNR